MPTVSLTDLQAAQQITRGMLTNIPGWLPALGTSLQLTYAFRSSATQSDFPLAASEMGGFARFTSAQIDQATLALSLWSDVANISFQRVGTGSTGEAAYSNSANLLFGDWTTGNAVSYAGGWGGWNWTRSAGVTNRSTYVWMDGTETRNTAPTTVNGGFESLLHEIGHSIGLSHPGSYNVAAGVTITYANAAEYIQDSHQYTVMSYFDESNTGASWGARTAQTPMLDDIVAAQLIYGANLQTRTGNTVYGFNSNADRAIFVLTSANDKPIFTVWDASGSDTFDFSGFTVAQTINLNAGKFSNVGGMVANVAIALGAVIEAAKGGSGADSFIGNSANNAIDGGGGLDTAQFLGTRAQYQITQPSGTIVVADTTANRDGTDTLSNVERLKFSDKYIAFDIVGNAGEAYRMYQAAFARTPDRDGVSFWVTQVDKGLSLHDLAGNFITSAEFRSIYGSSPTVQTLVTGFYTNVLGRAPDSGGLSFWVGQVQAGLSTADLLVSFSESAENKTLVLPAIQNGIELTLSLFA